MSSRNEQWCVTGLILCIWIRAALEKRCDRSMPMIKHCLIQWRPAVRIAFVYCSSVVQKLFDLGGVSGCRQAVQQVTLGFTIERL